MNYKMRFLIPHVLVIASLVLFAEQAIAQELTTSSSATQDQDCCWIDLETGKRVPTVPLAGVNMPGAATLNAGTALISEDRQSAHNTRTGKKYVKDENGCWIDVETGKQVPSVPLAGVNMPGAATLNAGTAVISEDRQTAHNTRTGKKYVRQPCPPPTGQGTPPIFKPNEINFNFSFIREDSDPRFNTYGFNGSYTHYLNPTVGLTGDVNAHFKNESGADLSKYSVLGGVTFVPFEGAKTTDKVTVSTHALFGVSHFKSDNGVSSFTDNAFTIKLGGAVDVNVNEHIFIRLPQIDYAPTFFGSNTQHNFQVGVGVGFRFGGK